MHMSAGQLWEVTAESPSLPPVCSLRRQQDARADQNKNRVPRIRGSRWLQSSHLGHRLRDSPISHWILGAKGVPSCGQEFSGWENVVSDLKDGSLA